jgi:hypothetical protein
MIRHISIPANDPKHVAQVLGELMGGRSYPFPGGVPDSFMAVAGDDHGTMIEVYPPDITLEPNDAPSRQPGRTPRRGAVHALLSVPLSREEIEAIGNREGWTTRFCGRGAPGQTPLFHRVEVWVEDHFMLEVVPQSMVGDYEKVIRFDRIEAFMAGRAG